MISYNIKSENNKCIYTVHVILLIIKILKKNCLIIRTFYTKRLYLNFYTKEGNVWVLQ